MLKIDLHIHSKYSGDSSNEPREIIRRAKDAGLDGVAVVDHGTIKGGVETTKANDDENFTVITGAEIKTDQGEIIGYFLDEEIKSRNFNEVIGEMRGQDAIITVPHPFDSFRMNRVKNPVEIASQLDAVEVFNSRCILDSSNEKALQFSKDHKLSATAGSDAHEPYEIGAAGITIQGDDIRHEISHNTGHFGRKNTFLVHARTRLRKLIGK